MDFPERIETEGLQPASNAGKEKGTKRGVTARLKANMRKVYVPLTLLGLGGLGWLFLSQRGREALRWMTTQLDPGRLLEWNEAAQRELDRIQVALNRVAESLEAAR